MIENSRTVPTMYERQLVRRRQDCFILHDRPKIHIPGSFLALSGSEMDVDDTNRGVVNDHPGDDRALIAVYTTDTSAIPVGAHPQENAATSPLDRTDIQIP